MRVLPLRHLPLHRARLLTAPVVEPLQTEQVMEHLRISSNDEIPKLESLIISARQSAEEYLRRALITQTWQFFLDTIPSPGIDEWWDGVRDGAIGQGMMRGMELPRPPLQSVTHVKSYTDTDVSTTFAPSNYIVDTISDPGAIALRTGGVWPVPTRLTNGFEIQFVCGYGATEEAIPKPILDGMLLLIGHLFENREATTEGSLTLIPWGITQLWDTYRVQL